MFVDLPQKLILYTGLAFFVGWILSAISSRMTARSRATKRDARDDRIRNLEAELRIAQSEREKAQEELEAAREELKEAHEGNEKRDNVITHQQSKLEEMNRDLKESVLKTRELRSELSDRATENLKSTVKLREVETELEVAQASTDMIATGVLDYSLAPDAEGAERDDKASEKSDMSKTAT
ncbi:MAG: hypothetical protein AAF351_06990 [Pseudomonadota bacterium]